MRRDDERLIFSATDLANHLACRHLTQLGVKVAGGELTKPRWHDERLEILRRRGNEHEARYVDSLRAQGRAVVDLTNDKSYASSRAAVERGDDVIVQAHLCGGNLSGYADVLERVETEHGHTYDVVDTKLAQNTRAGTVLQLCVYADLVGRILGPERTPIGIFVVKPGLDGGFEREPFRFTDFSAYYRFVVRKLTEDARMTPVTYPEPVAKCLACDWFMPCRERRVGDDHLSLVAGIRANQRAELEAVGIATLEALAEAECPPIDRPRQGSRESLVAVQMQARIQLKGRRSGAPDYEFVLPVAENRGLARLPEPSRGDLFFDLESSRFMPGGGMEYLFGWIDADGAYTARWAMDHTRERGEFERFIAFAMARWRDDPGMHIYHFAPYEPAAMKRLLGRYATCETEIDELLRGERFVDLYAVVRQGIRASVESYSIKELEPFFGYERKADLRDATRARHRIDCALELGESIRPDDRVLVEDYNREDCEATLALRDWLEARRGDLAATLGTPVARPEQGHGEAPARIKDRDARIQACAERLRAGLADDRASWTETDRARWLLSHLLAFFRREENCAWWEHYRLRDLDGDDIVDEREAIAGLVFDRRTRDGKKLPVDRYTFPPQEVAIDEGDTVYEIGGERVGTVRAVDLGAGTIDIKKVGAAEDVHPSAIFASKVIGSAVLENALLDIANALAASGLDRPAAAHRAATDLLLQRPPRLGSPAAGALRRDDEDVVAAAKRLAGDLDHGVLAIQGPPGTGKTYTGARMILELSRRGKRIGVTAISHKVIRNLLAAVAEAARGADEPAPRVIHRDKDEHPPISGVETIDDRDEVLAALAEGAVVGATAWFWTHAAAESTLDDLFVDEAGQMALAMVLATTRATRNVVLLGDPQQLEQPQRGAHPEGADIAALTHLLAGDDTIAGDKGLFLDQTWRMHPMITKFTSDSYYEGRLAARPELERQSIDAIEHLGGGHGLFHVPVEHHGNQSASPEEAEAIKRLVGDLVGRHWTDARGKTHTLTAQDILIVAPYNAQLALIRRALNDGGDATSYRIGTVDKFQGQEAPVVIYSMTSSSAEDAPRGMSFLYSPNRFNVATSRARCAVILVASPRIFEPECRTPEQIRYANGVCAYLERAVAARDDS